jgi:hypothetical protein
MLQETSVCIYLNSRNDSYHVERYIRFWDLSFSRQWGRWVLGFNSLLALPSLPLTICKTLYFIASLLQPWRWKQYFSSKHRHILTSLHGVTDQCQDMKCYTLRVISHHKAILKINKRQMRVINVPLIITNNFCSMRTTLKDRCNMKEQQCNDTMLQLK